MAPMFNEFVNALFAFQLIPSNNSSNLFDCLCLSLFLMSREIVSLRLYPHLRVTNTSASGKKEKSALFSVLYFLVRCIFAVEPTPRRVFKKHSVQKFIFWLFPVFPSTFWAFSEITHRRRHPYYFFFLPPIPTHSLYRVNDLITQAITHSGGIVFCLFSFHLNKNFFNHRVKKLTFCFS